MLEISRRLLSSTSSWSQAQGAQARLLRGAGGGERESIRVDPSPKEREAAKKLLILASSGSAREALAAGKLESLGAQAKGGVVVVCGRAKKAVLARLLGLEELLVVMPSEQLARRVMEDSHREDHRKTPQDILARSRRHFWIPRGADLARKVIKDCAWCRRENVKMQKQLMASLPEERLRAARPFQYSALDFFGPFQIKDLAKGRRRYKCWGVVYSCLASRAAALFACPGYDTRSFLTTHAKFTSVYGDPVRCYADHGSQIRAGAEELDWAQVSKEGSERKTE